MGMTIDEIIKYIPAPICGETEIGPEKQKEYDAHDTAVSILRNVQILEQILKNYEREGLKSIEISRVRMVLKNGNDD